MSIYVLLYIWRKLFTCSCVHRSNVSFLNFVVKTVDRHLKALVNEDLLRTHILLPMMFLSQHKLGNVCCGHKMFLNKIRNIFCPGHKFLSATNVAARGQTGKYLCRQQCVRNSVSATVCPSLPRPFGIWERKFWTLRSRHLMKFMIIYSSVWQLTTSGLTNWWREGINRNNLHAKKSFIIFLLRFGIFFYKLSMLPYKLLSGEIWCIFRVKKIVAYI